MRVIKTFMVGLATMSLIFIMSFGLLYSFIELSFIYFWIGKYIIMPIILIMAIIALVGVIYQTGEMVMNGYNDRNNKI